MSTKIPSNGLIPSFIYQQFVNQQFNGQFEAAVVYIDFIGFTSLTEKFMTFDRGGAESLSDALNQVFAPIVQEVNRRGGIIPLYAGDAFAAIFPLNKSKKRDIVAQALKAAVFMRNFFVTEGGHRLILTHHGEIKLGARIGLSMGSIQWSIPSFKEKHAFYFRGSGLSQSIFCQAIAKKGQIVCDNHIYDWIAPKITLLKKNQESDTYVIEAGPQLDHIEYPPANAPTQAKDLSPFNLDFVPKLTTTAEFRDVAVVFVVFDENANQKILNLLFSSLLDLSDRYGGYFHQIDISDKGGQALLLFGAPTAYENNTERAIELLLALNDQNLPIRWRAGVTWGTVWAGIRGGIERYEYAAIGDVVNLSARIVAKAKWGQVWVADNVRSQINSTYRFKNLGLFKAKGKEKSIPIHQLLDQKNVSYKKRFEGALTGRTRQINQLNSQIQPIFNSTFGGVIYVHGEAGVGKSRLIHHFYEQLTQKHDFYWFHCLANEILRPSLHPFIYFLNSYFEQSKRQTPDLNLKKFNLIYDRVIQKIYRKIDQDDPLISEFDRIRSIIAALIGLQWEDSLYQRLEPKLKFENRISAFKTLIKGLALIKPVIIHLEDAQWLDKDSKLLITKLTQNVFEYPLAIVCNSRPLSSGEKLQFALDDDIPKSTVIVKNLPKHKVAEMVSNMLSGSPSSSIVDLLAERSGGNPFFIEQLCLDLNERGLIHKTAVGSSHSFDFIQSFSANDEVPANLNSILISRLDRLTGGLKQIVQTASILGHEFEVEILSKLLEDDNHIFEKLSQGERENIWIPVISQSHYSFINSLLRDAAYGMQLRAKLRKIHALAAFAIERLHADNPKFYSLDIAHHYDKALQQEKASSWYLIAGENAASHFANGEALNCLNRSLELVPSFDLDKKFKILLSKEKVLGHSGNREEQLSVLESISKLIVQINDPFNTAVFSLRKANYGEIVGEYDQAIDYAENAYSLAIEMQNEEIIIESLLAKGRILIRKGEYEEAERTLILALDLDEVESNPHLNADINRFLGVVFTDLSNYARSEFFYENALKIYRTINDQKGESSILSNLGITRYSLGDLNGSLQSWEEAREICNKIGDQEGLCRILSNLSSVYIDIGDFQIGKKITQNALSLCREIQIPFGEVFNLINLSIVEQELGNERKAEIYGIEAINHAEALGSGLLKAYSLRDRGYILAKQKRLLEARASYLEAIPIWESLNQVSGRLETEAGLAQVELLLKNPKQALLYAGGVIDHLEQNGEVFGASRPILIYWICYQVLEANQNRDANKFLSLAYDKLMNKAHKIFNLKRKNTFLEDIPLHAAIIGRYLS